MSSPKRRFRLLGVALLALLPAAGAGVAATSTAPKAAAAPQKNDEEYAKLVKEWTTRPEFMSPLVDHLPLAPGIPTPRQVVGHYIGEPKKLTYSEDLDKYYRALEAKSPRIKVFTIGKTDEGRELVDVMIGSAESIRNLETYRTYLADLADPRKTDEAQAKAIIAKAKPIYHLMGGLHSGETGPSEMLMELAYRLVADESPLYKQIRDNVIVSILPAADPDGRDRFVDWYYHHKINDTSEDSAFGGPPYWGKYIFHDNNRDINASQVTSRAILEWYLKWHPPVMHDLHESVPFLYIYGAQPPHNPGLDPITYSEVPWFANWDVSQLEKYGMPGVWWWGYVDAFSPGYVAFTASNHNGLQRFYETFSNGGANTMLRHINRSPFGPSNGPGYTKKEWYRENPPYAEVMWSLRNNTNYMETGVLSSLQLASTFPKVLLDNFYTKSRNSLEDGRTKPPFGYVIPSNQRDLTKAAWMLGLLKAQGIEIGRATGEVKVKDGTFPAGSFVIKRDQPYARFVKVLLEKQVYPDPNLRTYDDAAWTMGLMAHTEVKAIDDKAILGVPTEPVTDLAVKGTIAGGTPTAGYAVMHNGSNNLITLRYRLKDLQVQAADRPFKVGDVEYPAGSFLIAGTDPRVAREIEALGLKAAALTAMPDVPKHDLNLPRLAIYSTWGSTQDVGWVRFALDKFDVPYDLIFKDEVKSGNLRSKYDLIVIPSQGRSAKSIVYDIEPKGKPVDYKKSPEFKSLGMYGEADDITGGMGIKGVEEFQNFVDQGGVLVTLGVASYLPPEFGLTRTIDAQRPTGQFYAPGPIVNADILQPASPVFYGYDTKQIAVRYGNGPLLRVPQDEKGEILMEYPGGDANVLSGLMKGANEIKNRPAIVDVPTGKGRIILFAGNPCYRWQNYGEFNLLFNTVLNFDDFKAAPKTPATQER
ncbi:MAG: M14 family zinc carboxypeptidase [Betaproteobacteria bacterium]